MKSIYQDMMSQEKREVQMVETAVEYVFIYGVILTFKSEKNLNMEELECLTLQIPRTSTSTCTMITHKILQWT